MLLKEDFTKAINYPMAMVLKTTENSLGEVTDVEVRRGSSREKVRRHVSSLIPFLGSGNETQNNAAEKISIAEPRPNSRPTRKAAKKARDACRTMLANEGSA